MDSPGRKRSFWKNLFFGDKRNDRVGAGPKREAEDQSDLEDEGIDRISERYEPFFNRKKESNRHEGGGNDAGDGGDGG